MTRPALAHAVETATPPTYEHQESQTQKNNTFCAADILSNHKGSVPSTQLDAAVQNAEVLSKGFPNCTINHGEQQTTEKSEQHQTALQRVGEHQSPQKSGEHQTNAPTSQSQAEMVANNARIVAEAARKAGVPEDLAVATMLEMSGGNNRAIGFEQNPNHNRSVGLFQAEVPNGQSSADATDPYKSAEDGVERLKKYANVENPGARAAAAMGIGGPAAHVFSEQVNHLLPKADKLLTETNHQSH